MPKTNTRSKTRYTKTTKKKPTKLKFGRSNKRWLPFVVLFALVGSFFVYRSFAATNTVTYAGQLSSSQSSQSYNVSVGDVGTLTAVHSSKDSSMRVSILNSAGTVVNTKTGSKASISSPVSPGTYSVLVDYAKEIKGVKKFKVTITYPIISTPPPPPPAPDTTPPTALITSPTGDVVSGTVNFSATAQDNVAVSKVEFLVDGTVVSSDSSSPYSYSWNTTLVSNGSHTIGIKAYDSSNNMSSASRPIDVLNSTTPPPPPTGYPAALWHGDADIDRDLGDQTLFMDKNSESLPTSRLSIVDDPLGRFGKVYQSQLLSTDISSGQKRAY